MTLSLAEIDPEKDLVAVIMAGGAGTRFWPVSTEWRPKQFLALLGERTLLQLEAARPGVPGALFEYFLAENAPRVSVDGRTAKTPDPAREVAPEDIF